MATDDGTVLRDGENELDDLATDGILEGDDTVERSEEMNLDGGVTDDPSVETDEDEENPDGTDDTDGGGI